MFEQQHAGTVEALVAEVLGLPIRSISDEMGFRTVPEWDSLRHVELMLALEERLGVEVGPDQVADLTTVGAIRRFAAGVGVAPVVPMPLAGALSDDPPPQRGLSGVEVDLTAISRIDGERGTLSYRGYAIDDLAANASFEEVVALLIDGDLPTTARLADVRSTLAEPVPPEALAVLRPEARPMDALRTGLSALAGAEPEPGSTRELSAAGMRLVGRAAAIVVEHHRLRGGAAGDGPRPSLAGTLLEGLTERGGDPLPVETLNQVLILLAEHGASASTFAARVAIGTRASLPAAITAAVATFGGPLHGGAIEGVARMIDEIGSPERAAEHVRAMRNRKEPVLGFGHRLYRTEDPRARLLREIAREHAGGNDRSFRIVEAVREAMRRHTRYGVDVNVDLYAGLVLRQLGIPTDLLTPVFVVARMAGWVAHCIEQRRSNVLIRPLLRYAGEPERAWLPIEARGERHGGAADSRG